MFAAIALQQVYHGMVDYLCLSVGLWMECRTSLQLGVHHSPQASPKISKEARVSMTQLMWATQSGPKQTERKDK